MCGICGMLSTENIKIPVHELYDQFFSIKHRGPEKTICVSDDKYSLCFHRLAINDTSIMGDQPFNFSYKFMKKDDNENLTLFRRSVYVMCNGEIYNTDELKECPDINKKIEELSFNYKSKSDCEVLIPLFLSTINEKYYDNKLKEDRLETQYENNQNKNEKEDNGIFKMMLRLSGEFAISIYDIFTNMETNETTYNLWLTRDRFGVRPLFFSELDDKTVMFGSEMKSINFKERNVKINHVDPRHWYLFSQNNEGTFNIRKDAYYIAGLRNFIMDPDITDIRRVVKEKLIEAVKKRIHCDREIGCLLSGGFDSSIVSAIAARLLLFENKKLRTFSIGMKDSPDIKYAQQVANHIGSEHTNIEVSKQDWLSALEDVIRITETFDVTTIRATIGQYLISKWIKENTDIKVLLIGDGSDELAGGYIYFNNAPSPEEFHSECVERLHYIHYFDALRSDRGISVNGLEARVPFLDEGLVDLYLQIDPRMRVSNTKEIEGKKVRFEKYLLRQVFDRTDYIPKDINWRKKEAFSDGVVSEEESLPIMIKNIVDEKISDEEYKREIDMLENKNKEVVPYSKEGLYYYKKFQEMFPNQEAILPYYWMPKWVENTNDPSARTLKIYNEENEKVQVN